jgi:hypothetical protein
MKKLRDAGAIILALMILPARTTKDVARILPFLTIRQQSQVLCEVVETLNLSECTSSVSDGAPSLGLCPAYLT